VNPGPAAARRLVKGYKTDRVPAETPPMPLKQLGEVSGGGLRGRDILLLGILMWERMPWEYKES